MTSEKNELDTIELFDTKLCHAIEAFPCLYNINSKLHRNKKACNAAWQTISTQCNDSINNCKERWIQLYKTFVAYNFDQTTTTELKLPEKQKQHVNKCLKFLIHYVPLCLEQLSDGNDKEIKFDSDIDNNINNKKESVTETSTHKTKENRTSVIHGICKNVTNVNGKYDSTGNSVDDANEAVDSSNNNNMSDKAHIPMKPGWNDEGKMPIINTTNDDLSAVISQFENNGEIAKVNVSENEEEGKRYNFRRTCKRHILTDNATPPEIITEKSDKEKRRKTSSSGFSEVSYPKRSSIISPSRKVEVKIARLSINKHVSPLKATKQSNRLKLNNSTVCNDSNKRLNDTSTEKPQLQDCSTQTESNSIYINNAFLNTIETQMNFMNSRQDLHFKFKVYKALMEVFDDASNFPNCNEIINLSSMGAPPFDTTTTAELQLMRELVALVQAAKQTVITSNTNNNKKDSKATKTIADNTITTSGTPKVTNTTPQTNSTTVTLSSPSPLSSSIDTIVTQTHVTPSSTDAPLSVTHNIEDDVLSIPRHIVRKVVKVGGVHGGTLMTQDGEKKRIYRIYPKTANNLISTSMPTTQRTNYSQSPNRNAGTGTFLITQSKDQNNHTLTTSSSYATVTTSNSSPTIGNTIRTMLANNNRNVGVNNFNKSFIVKSTDGSKTILTGSNAHPPLPANNINNVNIRSSQMRFQPPSQLYRRYSTATAPVLGMATSYANNGTTFQKTTVLTPTTTIANNANYKTVISRRMPMVNIIRPHTEMSMIRSIRPLQPLSQPVTLPSATLCTQTNTTTSGNSSNSLSDLTTSMQTKTLITQRQQQSQQPLPNLLDRTSNTIETIEIDDSNDPLSVKTEPAD